MKKELKELKLSAAIMAPVGVILYAFTEEILISIIVFVLFTLVVSIWGAALDRLGLKRHHKIIESEGFKKLISKGFRIEKVNDYAGLNGVYKGYLFDVYYNWLTTSSNNNQKALVLNIYFQPPKLNENQTNYKLLETISKKYALSIWSFRKYTFRWLEGNVLMNNAVGLKDPDFDFICKRMDLIIDILKKENLQPVEKTTVLERRKEDKFANIPLIETYYKSTAINIG